MTDLRMRFQHLDITVQDVIPLQKVVSRDQANIVALAKTDTPVIVPEVPQIFLITDMSDAVIGEGLSYLRRVIGRTVIHDQHFEIRVGLHQERIDAISEEVG